MILYLFSARCHHLANETGKTVPPLVFPGSALGRILSVAAINGESIRR